MIVRVEQSLGETLTTLIAGLRTSGKKKQSDTDSPQNFATAKLFFYVAKWQ